MFIVGYAWHFACIFLNSSSLSRSFEEVGTNLTAAGSFNAQFLVVYDLQLWTSVESVRRTDEDSDMKAISALARGRRCTNFLN